MKKLKKYCLFKYLTTCTFTCEECCYQCDILYYIDGNGINTHTRHRDYRGKSSDMKDVVTL